MKYITESLAEALYEARMARLNEDEEDLDYNDVEDREPESDDEEEVKDAIGTEEDEVDEARWVTMKNKNHALIDDDGSVLAGGDPKTRKKVSRKEIEAAAKSAGSK